ncbi:MAG: hypothetical protein IJT96_02335 [Lachnospiraceae bacterium]|nr:hypothetical protein [Lachnospiraceae bacterium]
MTTSIETMDKKEILSYLQPLVEPLQRFETLVDNEEKTQKKYQQLKQETSTKLLLITLGTTVIALICFFAFNKDVIIYNPPSFMKLLWLVVVGVPIAAFLIWGIP